MPLIERSGSERGKTIMDERGTINAASGWRGRCHAVCAALAIAGIALHLTVRDRIGFPVSGVFYGLPRPILLLLAGMAAATASRPRRRLQYLFITAAFAIWSACRDIAWNNAGSPAEAVVFWNVGHDLVEDVSVVDGFLETAPIVVGLVETGPLAPEWLEDWRRRRPDYEFVVPHVGMLLAVRGATSNHGYLSLGPNCHAAWCDVDRNGTPVRAVLVDLAAFPWVSRKEPLLKLTRLLASWGNRPILVMGDFNTPDDSVWFDGLRQDYREAFRAAGKGYVPTWPWPAPVLKLDHIWVHRGIDVRRSWATGTWRSDHRPVWGEVSLPPGTTAESRTAR
jgi:vancomycin resistance protein VanJ